MALVIPPDFVRGVEAALRDILPGVEILGFEDNVLIARYRGERGLLNLENIFISFRDGDGDIPSLVRHYFANLFDANDGPPDLTRIIPLVRATAMMENAYAMGASQGAVPFDYVMDPFAEGLTVFYVEDKGGFHFLSRESVKPFGEQAIRERAAANIDARADALRLRLGKAIGLATAADDVGNMVTGFLTRPWFWDRLATHVDGDVHFSAPDRDTIAFALNASGIPVLRASTDKWFAGDDHPLSPHIYVRKDGVVRKATY